MLRSRYVIFRRTSLRERNIIDADTIVKPAIHRVSPFPNPHCVAKDRSPTVSPISSMPQRHVRSFEACPSAQYQILAISPVRYIFTLKDPVTFSYSCNKLLFLECFNGLHCINQSAASRDISRYLLQSKDIAVSPTRHLGVQISRESIMFSGDISLTSS